ncbi:MAG TPA: FGGY family carbohydrate kinase [Dongiaceae bacterium]|jgi:xylulokinase|nr:FGGY family carbohydrate kinase [Dongiaceae bacterium]
MIVGVDIGTQTLKVCVLDRDLRVRGRAARRYPLDYPRPGWVEQDPRLWELALAPAVAESLALADAAPRDVTAIGFCGQLDGCIAVDDAGDPLTSCITWIDRRATAEIADVPADAVRETGGLVLDPGHLAAKARWLKRHARPARPIARFHQPVSYMVERLTGEAVIDPSLASTSMAYCLDRKRYDPTLLDCFELSAGVLPRIRPAESLAGGLTKRGAALAGLPHAVPVAVGTGDDFATPLGGGLVTPGRVAVSIGTGEVVGALHATALRDRAALVETHAYPGGTYFIENPGWLGGGSMVWLGSILAVSDFAAMDALAAGVPPGCEGLTFIPALSGAMAPQWQPDARGCFYGLTPAHGRGHMIRAVLEGCAFAMRDVVDHLEELGIGTDSLLLVGGGARSALWTQMRADIVGRSAEIPANVDCAPIGAAMLAAVAIGAFDTLPAAAQALGGKMRRLQPQAETAAAYEAAYARYRDLFRHLTPLFAPANPS